MYAMATVTAIGPDFFRVLTTQGQTQYEYRVVIDEQRVVEDGEVVERGEASVAKRTKYEDGDEVEVETDVSATKAVKEVMDERGYDVT